MSENKTEVNVLSEEELFAEILRRTGINVPLLIYGDVGNITIGELVAIKKACEELS